MKAIIFLLFIYLSHGQPCKKKSCKKICNTKSCTVAAANLIRSIDDTVNPCEDFYNFACGRFIKDTHIPQGRTKVDRFTQLEDKVKIQLKKLFEEESVKGEPKAFENVRAFYKSCTNKEKSWQSLADLKTIIASVGGWPLLEGEKWDGSKFEWSELEKKLLKSGLGQNGFIETYLNIDRNNSNKISVSVYEPFLGLDREELNTLKLTNGGFNNTDVENYYRLLWRQALLMGADHSQVVSDVREVILFLKDLDRIKFRGMTDYNEMSYDDKKLNISNYDDDDYEYQVDSNEKRMTILEITEIYPEVDWTDLLKSHLNDVDVNLDDNVEIIVENPEYLEKLRELLASVPARVQANFLFTQSLSKWLDELVEINQDFKEIWREYHQERNEVIVKPPEWEICIHSTSSILPIAVSSMFVRKYVEVETKHVMEKMVEDILEEVKKMLKESDWMDSTTKKKAEEKVERIEAFIAYPDELLDDTLIDDYYSGLDMSNKSFIINKIKNSKFLQTQNSRKIINYKGSGLWTEKAYFVPEVQAYYSNSENSIKFPAGILNDFFFGAELPNYMNYGGIGFVIGHEIIHGFDDEGSQYDGQGSLVDWWDHLTKEKYDNKTGCIVEQYGSKEEVVEGVAMSVDGDLTQGENIADNAGLKAATRTYQRLFPDGEYLLPGLNYTSKQFLWLSAANVWCQVMNTNEKKEMLLYEPHSPARTRINTLLGNMREFSQDWGCKEGDNMNPSEKCDVW